MKLALYARVSTEEQLNGYSIEIQVDKLTQYAKLNDYEYEVFTDEGYSAKDLNRPYIKILLDRLKNNEFDGIAIHKLDRLTRSVRDLQNIVDYMDQNNLKLISLNESFDNTTANGRLTLTMMGAVAQWERETIQERVCLGVKQAALSGKIVGTVPFGYNYDNKTGKVSVNEEEAEVVKIVFNMYAQGHGSNSISSYIFDNYPKEFMNFGNTQILRMIKRRSYLGESITRFKDGTKHVIPNAYPQIIDQDLFDKVQEVYRNKKEVATPRQKKNRRIFTGFLVCGLCGNAICGSASGSASKNTTLSYRCSHKYNRTKCRCSMFNEEELEKAFVEKMVSTLKSVKEGAFDINVSFAKANNKEKLIKELNQLKNKRKKCYIAFENDLISLEEFKERSNEFKQKEEELENEINTLQDVAVPKIFNFECDDFPATWNNLERCDKIALLHDYVKKIEVSKLSYLSTGRRESLVIHDITFI